MHTFTLPAGFEPTCLAHPDAYVNKVLVGCACGRLVLLNFATSSLLHVFEGFGAPVTCIAASPALDTVGVGLRDGRWALLNVRFDEALATFVHDAAGGAVTAIAFRTGGGAPVAVAGGATGACSVWDLDAQRLAAVLTQPHAAAVRAARRAPHRTAPAPGPPTWQCGHTRCGRARHVARRAGATCMTTIL